MTLHVIEEDMKRANVPLNFIRILADAVFDAIFALGSRAQGRPGARARRAILFLWWVVHFSFHNHRFYRPSGLSIVGSAHIITDQLLLSSLWVASIVGCLSLYLRI